MIPTIRLAGVAPATSVSQTWMGAFGFCDEHGKCDKIDGENDTEDSSSSPIGPEEIDYESNEYY